MFIAGVVKKFCQLHLNGIFLYRCDATPLIYYPLIYKHFVPPELLRKSFLYQQNLTKKTQLFIFPCLLRFLREK